MEFRRINLTFQPKYNEELDRLVKENSTEKFYSAGELLGMPGDSMNGIYFIKEGRTRHYMVNEEGVEKILYILTSGWMFGEMSYTLGYKTGLYSQAETNTIIYIIDKTKVPELLSESDIFRKSIMSCFASKVLTIRYEVENLTFNSCKERLTRLLCMLVDETLIEDDNWYELKMKYTHYQIGVIIGSARVTVSKLINELCNDKFIRIINRRIQVNKDLYDEYIKMVDSSYNE